MKLIILVFDRKIAVILVVNSTHLFYTLHLYAYFLIYRFSFPFIVGCVWTCIQINVNNIDGAYRQHIVVFLNASIFADIVHFLYLFFGDGEHILDVVDVDVDKTVDEEDGWAFVVVGNEGVGSYHDEEGDDEDNWEDHEDIASPEFRGLGGTDLSVAIANVEDGENGGDDNDNSGDEEPAVERVC